MYTGSYDDGYSENRGRAHIVENTFVTRSNNKIVKRKLEKNPGQSYKSPGNYEHQHQESSFDLN